MKKTKDILPECDKRFKDLHSDGLGGRFVSFSCSIPRYGDISCGSLLANNKCPLNKKLKLNGVIK